MAVSRFGFTWHMFLSLTPREFSLALEDNQRNELSRVRPIAEAIRMSTWWLVNIQLEKGKKIKKKEQLMMFGWESEEDLHGKAQTAEEMKSVMRFIARATKDKKERKKH